MKNLAEKIKKYGLIEKDWHQHKHYTIITRMGIDKIQAFEKITIDFEAVKVEPEFCVVKATGAKGELTVQTFGSAKYGDKEWVAFDKPNQYGKTGKWSESGNTSTWYVMEMAEKRAMSRVVLKITGFYELGVFGEDESESFVKQPETERTPTVIIPSEKLNACKNLKELQSVFFGLTRTEQKQMEPLKNELKTTLNGSN